MREERSTGLNLAKFTPSTAVRECCDCVCAEDTRGFVEGVRDVSRMAQRICGGAAGRKEGFRPRGTSSSFQGDETTKPEPVLDGFDYSNLEWKLHESALRYGTVEKTCR